MKHIPTVLFLLSAGPAAAQVTQFPAAQLKGLTKSLAAKMSPQKLATEQLGKFRNHSLMAAHREASGEAELHETQADVFIVQSGEATLHTGGEVVGGKTTAPGEIRGASIKGGQKMKLGPGDIVEIPAKTPHQTLVAPGKHITYLIVKVDTP